jgi:nicotinamidase-related amidase
MEFDLTHSQAGLLVLDLQELFCSAKGPFENKNADELISKVNTFAGDCDKLGLPLIYSRYLFKDDLSDAGLLKDNPVVLDGHFCESSAWMKLDQRLKLPRSAIQLKRNRPGAFWNNDLELVLKENRIDTLLLCGLSVNNAISTTAREAFSRDIPTLVIKECTGAAPWETEIDNYFETLHTWTAEVASTASIKNRLNKGTNTKS